MYDVEDLEHKWRVYKSKKRTPWYIFIILELVVVIYYVNRVDVNRVLSTYIKDNNMSEMFQFDNKDDGIIENEVDSNQTILDKKVEFKIDISDPELQREVETEHERKYLKIEVTDKYPNSKKVKNRESNDEEVIDFKTMKTIKSVKIDFMRTKNYKDSLYLAETYYENGEYEEAEKWALVTNNINNEVEDSWLIFVKAKIKMGDIEEAQEVLDVYIKKTNSDIAKKLLIDIKQNKL